MNGTPRDIADTVEYWRSVKPAAEALRVGSRAWSWTELAERIRRNAAAQLASGLRAGDRIVSYDKNHPFCLETALACTLTGTANAVVNFRLAPPEVAYIINDSRRERGAGRARVPAGAGTDPRRTAERAHGDRASAATTTSTRRGWPATSRSRTPSRSTRRRLFLQLYTSGTTGFPKGAMITQRGMNAHVATTSRSVGHRRGVSVSMVAMPLFHVGGSSYGRWRPCSTARGMLIIRDINPAALVEEMIEQGVSHTFFVPALLRRSCSRCRASPSATGRRCGPGLRRVADAVAVAARRAWRPSRPTSTRCTG